MCGIAFRCLLLIEQDDALVAGQCLIQSAGDFALQHINMFVTEGLANVAIMTQLQNTDSVFVIATAGNALIGHAFEQYLIGKPGHFIVAGGIEKLLLCFLLGADGLDSGITFLIEAAGQSKGKQQRLG